MKNFTKNTGGRLLIAVLVLALIILVTSPWLWVVWAVLGVTALMMGALVGLIYLIEVVLYWVDNGEWDWDWGIW